MYDPLNHIFSEPESNSKLASVCCENELEPRDVKWLSQCCPEHCPRGGPEGRRPLLFPPGPAGPRCVHGACLGHVCR